jgi:SAM-dependent methyltransferase
MRALCIADGEGRNSVWLAQQGLDVTAFDFSPVAVSKARALAGEAGVQVDYRQSDIFAWDWKRQAYDVVVAIFFQFASPPQRAAIFSGLQQALAPGGLLLLHGYRPEQIAYGTGGPSQPENMYTEALLRDAFAALDILELRSYDAEVDEGSGHVGMSALIDLIARKPAR